MTPLTRRFQKDDRGSTAIEYGLIVGLIMLGIVTALGSVGDRITFLFSDTDSKLVESFKG
ncbi:pilus assembly protein Flp/PilA [Pseudaminobacter salicylatoxidans]|uniref:Pilus assembly protein Flp/PilA n=1 Tax=Pseudaminobacter salicylatoxidans TaxID=93369 RepID=A0A316C6T2_PSESE|nr:Flp family type IVb pilin [Pseudaminobacter salicylatoxidans]PWJ84756.1 pilus assembly protein Flp/PilA [Pseudaminobacter salicylatoxidans]